MKYPLAFQNFWKLYPRRVGKKVAFKMWEIAIEQVEPEVIMRAVREQLEAGEFTEVRYTPHPSTWLRGERWEDEVRMEGMEGLGLGQGSRNVLAHTKQANTRMVVSGKSYPNFRRSG